MQDLKDVTNNVHYENYRCLKLAGVVNSPDPKHFQAPSRCVCVCACVHAGGLMWFNNYAWSCIRDPLAQFEVEKREHEVKMHKMEREMEEVFEMKVQEKLQKLRDIEADVSLMRGQVGCESNEVAGSWA